MKSIFILCAGVVCGFCLGRCSAHSDAAGGRADTVFIRTPPVERVCTVGVLRARVARTSVRPIVPEYTDSTAGESAAQEIALPLLASIIDSLDVELPREQAVYSAAGYRAYVSGYAPALDSLVLSPPRLTVGNRSRVSLGLQVGVGLTPAGAQPYIGFGMSFRLF